MPEISWADPYPPGDYSHHLLTQIEPPVRSFWGANDSALDESCLDPAWAAAHNLIGSHPQICYDTTYTLMNHITTPVFLRQDINDPLSNQRYVDWALYATPDAFLVGAARAAQPLRGLHPRRRRARAPRSRRRESRGFTATAMWRSRPTTASTLTM